jgi:hypothetical protein
MFFSASSVSERSNFQSLKEIRRSTNEKCVTRNFWACGGLLGVTKVQPKLCLDFGLGAKVPISLSSPSSFPANHGPSSSCLDGHTAHRESVKSRSPLPLRTPLYKALTVTRERPQGVKKTPSRTFSAQHVRAARSRTLHWVSERPFPSAVIRSSYSVPNRQFRQVFS